MAGKRSINAIVSATGASNATPSGADVTLYDSVALYVGGSGDIDATLVSGQRVVFPSVPAGIFPIQAATIHNGTTTATGVFALYN